MNDYKNIINIGLVLLMTFYTTSCEKDKKYVNSKNGLNLREKPTIDSNIIITIPNREKLEIIKYNKEDIINGIKGRWVKINSGENVGWVFSGYLSNTENINFVQETNKKEHKLQFKETYIIITYQNNNYNILIQCNKNNNSTFLTLPSKSTLYYEYANINNDDYLELLLSSSEGEDIYTDLFQIPLKQCNEEKRIMKPIATTTEYVKIIDLDNDGYNEIIFHIPTNSIFGEPYFPGQLKWDNVYTLKPVAKLDNKSFPYYFRYKKTQYEIEVNRINKQINTLKQKARQSFNSTNDYELEMLDYYRSIYTEWVQKAGELSKD